MAASISSSVSSCAPVDFRLVTSLEDASHAFSVAVERCPLCYCSKRLLLCSSCVRSGNFTRSSVRNSTVGTVNETDRYCEKLQKWEILKHERLKLLNRFKESTKHLANKEEKLSNILLTKQHILELHKTLKLQRHSTDEDKEALRKLLEQNTRKQARLQKFEERKDKICKRLKQFKESINERNSSLKECQTELQVIRKDHALKLVEHIFPITNIQGRRAEVEDVEGDTLSELADAQQMSFIQGRWVYTNADTEEQYQIIEPTLPGNGDYSQYKLLKSEIEQHHDNPVYGIGAALAYTAQLVCVMSWLLDVSLTKSLSFRDFCNPEMTEKQRERAVRRLNSRVLHLCFSQNVDPANLNPKLAIQNILHLLEAPDLGRHGSYEVHTNVLEDIHSDGKTSEESEGNLSESDEIDFTGADWERVPVSIPEVDPSIIGASGTSSDTSAQSSTIVAAGGLMSSAVASVASFFRTPASRTDNSNK